MWSRYDHVPLIFEEIGLNNMIQSLAKIVHILEEFLMISSID